jgi:hypothetical protein
MTTTLDGIPLSPRLQWTDEFASAAVAQSLKRTLDGGVALFAQPLPVGLPITLASAQNAGWMRRPEVRQIMALAAQPGGQWTLSLRGNDYTVAFRHHEPPAFQAAPLVPYSEPDDDSIYLVTIKLITVG